MEKRKVKIKVAGIYHLGDLALGFSQEEQKTLESLTADGMDKKQAQEFVRKMRKDQANMMMAAGEVVTVIGRTSWPEEKDDPNPVLIVQSATGVVGLIRASNTDKAEG